MIISASHNSDESNTRSALHPRRAAAAIAVSIGIVIALWSGMWKCPSAFLFHFPCPACGSTRAMHALFYGHFKGVLLNPMAPFASLAFGLILARAVWLELTDGDLRRLGDGAGAFAVRALLVVSVAEIAIWACRWFGLFGGPVPI